MKRVFTFLFFMLVSLNFFAQDPQIFQEAWRVEAVTLNGIYYPAPPRDSGTFPGAGFYETEVFIGYCDGHSGLATFSETENIFNLENEFAILEGYCTTSPNQNFQSLYFPIFWDNNQGPMNPYSYTIVDDGNIKLMQVENANGAIAHYTNATLNVTDFKDVTIALYPNPANEHITIASNDASIENLSIFNIQGEEVMTVKFQQNNPTLNISNLQAGVYFLKAESDTGQQLTTKFVKQ